MKNKLKIKNLLKVAFSNYIKFSKLLLKPFLPFDSEQADAKNLRLDLYKNLQDYSD